jgi:cytidylate kinase
LKYKNIAVSGKNIASGSTTLAKLLAERLGWQFHSAGEIFRQYCQEKGWAIERYHEIPDEIDKEVDKKAKEMLKIQKKIVYEAWLVGWLAKDMPDVFRILCVAPLGVRIKRFAQREGDSLAEARKKVLFRDRTTVEKHQRLYQIKNQFDPSYFDLIIHTDQMTPEEEVQLVLRKII